MCAGSKYCQASVALESHRLRLHCRSKVFGDTDVNLWTMSKLSKPYFFLPLLDDLISLCVKDSVSLGSQATSGELHSTSIINIGVLGKDAEFCLCLICSLLGKWTKEVGEKRMLLCIFCLYVLFLL